MPRFFNQLLPRFKSAELCQTIPRAGGKGGEKLARRLAGVLVLTLMLVSLVTGCQAQKKPTLPNTKAAEEYDPSKLTPTDRRVISNRLSDVASTVTGVQRAIVVLSSDNKNKIVVLVGLTLTPDAANKQQQVKSMTADKIKKSDKRVTQVLVTTDPNMVKRISDIAAGIIQGKPVKSYARDVDELTRNIKR
jgi:YhcN/YlaJ family sporulation lipoprotein